MKFAFICAKTGQYPTAWLCRRLGVSTSGYYEWRQREPSKRQLRDDVLRLKIRAFFRRSCGRYGSPRIHDELIADGERVSRKRVARLMREMGLYGRRRRRFRRTTDSNHRYGYAANLVNQDFTASGPDKLWLVDLSYIRTWDGWMYLAVVIDAFSRRVVGFAIDEHMRADLARDALSMAIRQRSPAKGLIHHSDRGSQYCCGAYRQDLTYIGAIQSMSGVGNCYDNAVAESFFATIKEELIYRNVWPSKNGVAESVSKYIEGFYNPVRRHSTIGRISPIEYEARYRQQAA